MTQHSSREFRKRQKRRIERVSVRDERFDPNLLSKLPLEDLLNIRKRLNREVGSAQGDDRIRLGRQISWLDKRCRDINFFKRLREIRGAPEDKEARTDIFARAFFQEARKILEGDTFKEICQAAAEISGLVDDDPSRSE